MTNELSVLVDAWRVSLERYQKAAQDAAIMKMNLYQNESRLGAVVFPPDIREGEMIQFWDRGTLYTVKCTDARTRNASVSIRYQKEP